MARIIIVDDSDPELRLLASAVVRTGHEPTTVRRAAELATRCAELNAEVVMLDLHVPDSPAYPFGLTPEIRDVLDRVATIVVSNADEGERRRAAERLGAVAHLQKPVSDSALKRAIRKALRGRPRQRPLRRGPGRKA